MHEAPGGCYHDGLVFGIPDEKMKLDKKIIGCITPCMVCGARVATYRQAIKKGAMIYNILLCMDCDYLTCDEIYKRAIK